MKIAVLITSTIEVDNKTNFIYQPHLKRSFWTTEQRLEQTIHTINQFKKFAPNIDLYLLDSSKNFQEFQTIFSNINYIPLYSINPNIIEKTHTSKIKGLCESLLLDTFIDSNKENLLKYDYIIKITGRYFINETFDLKILNSFNMNKIFTKEISWVDIEKFKNTGYELFCNKNKKFPYVLTCIYSIGKYKFDLYFNSIKKIIYMYENYQLDDVALETLFFHTLLTNFEDYYHIPWKVYGLCGVTGQSIHY